MDYLGEIIPCDINLPRRTAGISREERKKEARGEDRGESNTYSKRKREREREGESDVARVQGIFFNLDR